jgi:hypothetical protein
MKYNTTTDNDRRFRETFEIVTHESAENGEAAENGFIEEYGHSVEPDEYDIADGLSAVDLAARFLADRGATEFCGRWWTRPDADIDYRTGEHETRSFHPVDFSDEEIGAINAKLKQSKPSNP